MNVLGVKVTSHDTGAALIVDGRVTAIAEERLCRIKHSQNIFPSQSINYCLQALGVGSKDIDLVVIDKIGLTPTVRWAELFHQKTGGIFSRVRLEAVNHHDAHAASAFFCSPFEEAAILVIDGAGERTRTNLGVEAIETETLYRGTGNQIFQIHKTRHLRRRAVFPYTFGIGKLYTLISEGLINFGHYNEGKMMGLAPYGSDVLLKQFPPERWFVERDGEVLCNARIFFPGYEEFLATKKTEGRLKTFYRRLLEAIDVLPVPPPIFEPIHLPYRRRAKTDPLPDERYAATAYAAQKLLEEVVARWGRKLKDITQSKNLCYAGGVALNIDANKRLFDDVGFERLFIQPGATDTGIALGCALYGYHIILGQPRFWEMKSASLGRPYSEEEVPEVIEKYQDKIEVKKSVNVAKETARLVSEGRVVGWFQGGSEYGPRALGNRSILCDARRPEMKDIVNNKVKHREPWRPFAASVLAEKQREWFELDHESPFMLLAAPVVKEKRRLIPAVVHVDGTCRIQSVTAEANHLYYDFLKEFDKLTGVPLVLNTSFNLAGDPIIETPEDALTCFLKTQMDYLVLHHYIVEKKL